MKKQNSTRQINRLYQGRMKALIKGQHEEEIFASLKNGKNSYLRLDRLASSSFDKSWIETIEDVIFDLGAIIANPRSVTKTEGSITPVELARKINSESVQHLASHTQYIKEVDDYGNVIPSKLLSMYSEDDIHTYENRFIATFVRRLMLFISKRYEYITQFAELRNEEVLFFKNYSVIDGADVEIETKVKVSYKNEDEEAVRNSKYIDRIIQTRQYILYFYNSPFMKALKTEKDVRNPIIQTNIIRKNPKYRHCYEVYKFIESYDKLGVNYKIDENYSQFNDEEINELNRTLFANYITLKGNSESKSSKKNTKVYKPKILTSMDDESFIYGPLFEGPIEFVRVDEGYQKYLDSKVRKDLPLHPTKKEKEYYSLEYEKKSENKEDLKQKNDLIKRTEKQVNQFEKSVKNILAKREEARLKLLELEKETIRQEEIDLLEAARREIIEASKADQQKEEPKEEAPVVETPKEEPVKEKEIIYVPTVSFDDAAKEIWPQLNKPLKKAKKAHKEAAPVVAQPMVEEKQPEVVEQVQPEVIPEAPSKEEAPVQEQPKIVYEPTVSFEEAADEIWPQLNNPTPMAKPEEVNEQPVVASAPKEEAAPIEESTPETESIVPSVSFEDAADEVWPQLNNPTPMAKPEEIIEQPVVAPVPIKKTEVVKKPAPAVRTILTISFEKAADEVWPQLKNPKPLPKKEVKEAPVVTPTSLEKPEVVDVPKEEPIPQPQVVEEPKGDERKVRARFKIYDGSEVVIFAKSDKKKVPDFVKAIQEKKAAKQAEEAKQVEQTKENKEEKKPEPKVEAKPLPKQDNKQNHSLKEEKKESRPQKVIKGKNSRKKFRK